MAEVREFEVPVVCPMCKATVEVDGKLTNSVLTGVQLVIDEERLVQHVEGHEAGAGASVAGTVCGAVAERLATQDGRFGGMRFDVQLKGRGR